MALMKESALICNRVATVRRKYQPAKIVQVGMYNGALYIICVNLFYFSCVAIAHASLIGAYGRAKVICKPQHSNHDVQSEIKMVLSLQDSSFMTRSELISCYAGSHSNN